jgi:hypothetical protein
LTHETLLLAMLVAQGVMGAIDTLVNHEFIAGLPGRHNARYEVGVHAIREAFYGAVFIALAWFELHGALAVLIAVLFGLELVVMASDEFIENRIRVLPQNERVLHLFLSVNFAVIATLLAPILLEWAGHPTGLVAARHGGWSWALSALGLASAAWSLRDALAFHRLGAGHATLRTGGAPYDRP